MRWRDGVFGRMKDKVKKVYMFFGNRVLGNKADAAEVTETAIDMETALNN